MKLDYRSNWNNQNPFFELFETFENPKSHNRKHKHQGGFPFADVYVDHIKNQLVFEVAIAGYDKEQVEITTEDQTLTIEFNVFADIKPKTNVTYIEQKIAKRNFSRAWTLSPDIKTDSAVASYDNGILNVVFDITKDEPSKTKININ